MITAKELTKKWSELRSGKTPEGVDVNTYAKQLVDELIDSVDVPDYPWGVWHEIAKGGNVHMTRTQCLAALHQIQATEKVSAETSCDILYGLLDGPLRTTIGFDNALVRTTDIAFTLENPVERRNAARELLVFLKGPKNRIALDSDTGRPLFERAITYSAFTITA